MGGTYNKDVQLDSARRHGYAAQIAELEGQKPAKKAVAKKTTAKKPAKKAATAKKTAKKA